VIGLWVDSRDDCGRIVAVLARRATHGDHAGKEPMHIETCIRARVHTPKTRVISPRLWTQMTSSQAQREHPLITHAHPNVRNRCQKGGH